MNKKIVLFGCLLAVFLLLMIPSVDAVGSQQIKESQVLKDIPLSLKSIKEKGYLDDPGNGTDGNGPDDITDYLYGILLLMLSPITIPIYIFAIFVVILALWQQVCFETPILCDLVILIEYALSPFMFLTGILLNEYRDTQDFDGDGR